jgi:hypothetical protein
MAKIDIYTYFTAQQTKDLLVDSRRGTRAMLKNIERNFPNDYRQLVEAIADCLPQLVAEDRLLTRGPRKGQRKILFWNNETDISDVVSRELTGVTRKRFIRAWDYMKKSMVETVLTPPENSLEYSKLWVKTFLDDNTNFNDLRPHYRKMTEVWVASAQACVDDWIAANKPDMVELMTWDSDKYNEWHFANVKRAA